MNAVLIGALGAAGGALLVAIGSALYHAARKRIRPSLEAEAVNKIVPTVNLLVAIQGPSLDLMIAIGEKTLGADEQVVKDARESRDSYQQFLKSSAEIKVAC